MKKRIPAFILFSMLAATTVYSQALAPLELAKRIFGKDSLPDIGRYITGEYTGRPNGRDISNAAITKFMVLEQKDSTAVVAMTLFDSAGHGLDTYLHFVKDTVWKMNDGLPDIGNDGSD